MSSTVTVHLKIYNRTYKIKTGADEEEALRKKADVINEKLNLYKMNFPGRDAQDYLALAIIELLEGNQSPEHVVSDDWKEAINSISSLLNDE